MLREMLEGASTSTGHVVGIVGEPGAGKSRLLYEFERLVRGRQIRYIQAHCVAYGGATPYLPLIEMLRAALELAESDSPATIAEQGPGPAPPPSACPPTRPALAAPAARRRGGRGGPPAAEGQDVRRVAPDGGERRAAAAARAGVENVHWMDPTSEECLAHLAGAVHGLPLLLVMTYRPGYRPPWLGHAYASQLALRPLSDDASRRLLRSVVGAAALGPEVESQVLGRAEGNPFFLEELGRAVVEHGDEGPQAVPPTVQAALAARIDRLAPEDKRLLQTAAVIGPERAVRAAGARHRAGRAGARSRHGAPGRGRVPVRGAAPSRARLRVQARAHPGRGLRRAARRRAARAAP